MFKSSIIVLGSSSGVPQANRACSGYLLKTGDRCTLIDCGGGVTSSLLKTKIDPMSVERIFISHTHSDHVCELTLLIQLMYVKGRTNLLELYIPSEFVDMFHSYLAAVYMLKENFSFALKVVGYGDGLELNTDTYSIKAYQTRHLEKHKDDISKLNLPNKMQCHCFVIELENSRVFYSADISRIDDVKKHFGGCKYVIIESTHIDIEELLKIARSGNAENYIITHLGSPEEVSEIKQKIAKSSLRNVTIAEDRLELPI